MVQRLSDGVSFVLQSLCLFPLISSSGFLVSRAQPSMTSRPVISLSGRLVQWASRAKGDFLLGNPPHAFTQVVSALQISVRVLWAHSLMSPGAWLFRSLYQIRRLRLPADRPLLYIEADSSFRISRIRGFKSPLFVTIVLSYGRMGSTICSIKPRAF